MMPFFFCAAFTFLAVEVVAQLVDLLQQVQELLAAARGAVDASPLWLALGVLVVPNRTLVTLPPPAEHGADVAWRIVRSPQI